MYGENISNRVWTLDAFSLVLVVVLIIDYYTFTSLGSSDSYTCLFQTLTYFNFWSKTALKQDFKLCVTD